MFGNLDKPGSLTGTSPAAQAASEAMSRAFVALARHGDPAAGGVPAWPRYDLTRRATMIFDAQSHVADDPRGAERRLFEAVPYIKPGT